MNRPDVNQNKDINPSFIDFIKECYANTVQTYSVTNRIHPNLSNVQVIVENTDKNIFLRIKFANGQEIIKQSTIKQITSNDNERNQENTKTFLKLTDFTTQEINLINNIIPISLNKKNEHTKEEEKLKLIMEHMKEMARSNKVVLGYACAERLHKSYVSDFENLYHDGNKIERMCVSNFTPEMWQVIVYYKKNGKLQPISINVSEDENGNIFDNFINRCNEIKGNKAPYEVFNSIDQDLKDGIVSYIKKTDNYRYLKDNISARPLHETHSNHFPHPFLDYTILYVNENMTEIRCRAVCNLDNQKKIYDFKVENIDLEKINMRPLGNEVEKKLNLNTKSQDIEKEINTIKNNSSVDHKKHEQHMQQISMVRGDLRSMRYNQNALKYLDFGDIKYNEMISICKELFDEKSIDMNNVQETMEIYHKKTGTEQRRGDIQSLLCGGF